MPGLLSATSVEPIDEGFRVDLDPDWDIWGPAGGYIAAIALLAVRDRADEGQRPLTLTGQFLRVAKPGALEVHIEQVKTGATALFTVRLHQDDKSVFLAQIWTSARAEPSLPVVPAVPRIEAPQDLRSQDELVAERGIKQIAFWRNIDGRPANFRIHSDPPAADTHQYRWMRFRDWQPTDDPFLNAMRYALLIDIGVWPAHWHRLGEQADYVAPSLDIWVHFHGGPPGDEWLLSDANTDVSGNGTISGSVRIWSQDGAALATGGGHCLVTLPRR